MKFVAVFLSSFVFWLLHCSSFEIRGAKQQAWPNSDAVLQAIERRNDSNLQLRGPRIRREHGPDHNHFGQRWVGGSCTVPDQHEVGLVASKMIHPKKIHHILYLHLENHDSDIILKLFSLFHYDFGWCALKQVQKVLLLLYIIANHP